MRHFLFEAALGHLIKGRKSGDLNDKSFSYTAEAA